VKNYLAKGEELFERYNMLGKVNQVEAEWPNLTEDQRELALNKIDKEATELLLSTEKHCRKLRTGAIAFLPELSKKGLT